MIEDGGADFALRLLEVNEGPALEGLCDPQLCGRVVEDTLALVADPWLVHMMAGDAPSEEQLRVDLSTPRSPCMCREREADEAEDRHFVGTDSGDTDELVHRNRYHLVRVYFCTVML